MFDAWCLVRTEFSLFRSRYLHSFFFVVFIVDSDSITMVALGQRSNEWRKGERATKKPRPGNHVKCCSDQSFNAFNVTNNSQQITHATRIEHKNALPTYMMARGWVPIRWYWMWASLSICIYVPISLSSSSSAHFVRVPVNCAARSYVARVASAVYVLVSDFFVSFCVLISCQR